MCRSYWSWKWIAAVCIIAKKSPFIKGRVGGGEFVIKLWKGCSCALKPVRLVEENSCHRKHVKDGIQHKRYPKYNSIHLYIFRSGAANTSVLASPRMIPICIVASPPWDSIQRHLHTAQWTLFNSWLYQCIHYCAPVDWQGTRLVGGRIEQPAVNRDQLSILIPHTISSTNLLFFCWTAKSTAFETGFFTQHNWKCELHWSAHRKKTKI